MSKLKPSFSYSFIYSDLDPNNPVFSTLLSNYKTELNNLGGKESQMSSSLHFFFMTSGGTEKALLKTIYSIRSREDQSVVYIIAHPEFNSLPASLEALARLQMDGKNGEIIFFQSPDDKESQARILELAGV